MAAIVFALERLCQEGTPATQHPEPRAGAMRRIFDFGGMAALHQHLTVGLSRADQRRVWAYHSQYDGYSVASAYPQAW